MENKDIIQDDAVTSESKDKTNILNDEKVQKKSESSNIMVLNLKNAALFHIISRLIH